MGESEVMVKMDNCGGMKIISSIERRSTRAFYALVFHNSTASVVQVMAVGES